MTTRATPLDRKMCLTMALYTFLLALGAAVPVAASYAGGGSATDDEAALSSGGFRCAPAVETEGGGERAEAPSAEPRVGDGSPRPAARRPGARPEVAASACASVGRGS